MMYAAVHLCPEGGIVRHETTLQAANVLVGDFPSMEDATKQACIDLKCTELRNSVITKGYGKGGYMLVATQDLEEV